LRDTLIKRAETNPFLLRHYAELLLLTYRSQASVFYLPPTRELESVLERLTQTDLVEANAYRLELAALAWDRGDSASCIRLGESLLAGADGTSVVHTLDRIQSVDGDAPARLVEALLSVGKANEALAVCQQVRRAGFQSPVLDMLERKSEAAHVAQRQAGNAYGSSR
jgi:hypothetical protein